MSQPSCLDYTITTESGEKEKTHDSWVITFNRDHDPEKLLCALPLTVILTFASLGSQSFAVTSAHRCNGSQMRQVWTQTNSRVGVHQPARAKADLKSLSCILQGRKSPDSICTTKLVKDSCVALKHTSLFLTSASECFHAKTGILKRWWESSCQNFAFWQNRKYWRKKKETMQNCQLSNYCTGKKGHNIRAMLFWTIVA